MPFDPAGHELRLEALDKIERVIDLLSARERWCKRAFKTEDGRMCILGAVRAVDAELLLYAPILRSIREVTGHAYRRIEHFNDSWVASYPLVLQVLEQTRHQLALGLVPATPASERSGAPRGQRASLVRRLVAGLTPARGGSPCS
jgi:hypothetical protein